MNTDFLIFFDEIKKILPDDIYNDFFNLYVLIEKFFNFYGKNIIVRSLYKEIKNKCFIIYYKILINVFNDKIINNMKIILSTIDYILYYATIFHSCNKDKNIVYDSIKKNINLLQMSVNNKIINIFSYYLDKIEKSDNIF